MTNINLDLQMLDTSEIEVSSVIQNVNASAGSGDEVWRNLYQEPMQSLHVEQIQAFVKPLGNSVKNVLVLGIGGSALGAKALFCALSTQTNNPQLFVLDNIDSHSVKETIATIKKRDTSLKNTIVIVISKSGNTAEIAALCMVARRELSQARFVAVTGKTGALHRLATREGWTQFPVPDGVGGRFSVLSPVGLLPAALCGIDIQGMLEGAREMDVSCRKLEGNPAADLATSLTAAMQGGRNIHVMMSYCDRLSPLTQWFVQLWAESLGKQTKSGERVGPTPVAAIGATDQHSMLQLWREGPKDKVIGFVHITELEELDLGTDAVDPELEWLCNQSMEKLLDAEMFATIQSMRDAGQSTWTLTLPKLDANHVGQFIALWEITVAIAGRILDINPYDQAGVELGKQLTRKAFD